jgi:hypothetical protein
MAASLAGQAPIDLAALIERTSPGGLAHERLIEVSEELKSLLPLGGLRRGSTVAVGGPAAVSLTLALCAKASRGGAWVGMVGLDSLGLQAADEYGLALDRLFLVAAPPERQWAEIVTIVAEGAELVIARSPKRFMPGDVRRVQARVASRGSVLVLVDDRRLSTEAEADLGGGWSPEVRLATHPLAWEGLGEGHGRLVSRRVAVSVSGRRSTRPHRVELLLPGPQGVVAAVSNVTPRRQAG